MVKLIFEGSLEEELLDELQVRQYISGMYVVPMVLPGMAKKEITSFRQASSESEAQWEAFLRDLYER